MAKIIIPTPLRKFTNNEPAVELPGATVAEAIQQLIVKYPPLQQQLLDEQGQVRHFIKIFVGDDDINLLQREKTPVDEKQVISIVPAIAGGLLNNDSLTL